MPSDSHFRRPTGSIIGRSDEVRTVQAAVDRGRLVTLLGSGGVGKTALAAEVAHNLEPEFDRVVAIELVTVESLPEARTELAAAVLHENTDNLGRVAEVLDGVETLLVLDNCEHLVADVAVLVQELLDATTSLRILSTSRRPLNLADEILVTVQPLPTPEAHGSDRDLVSSPAIQLFLERVRQAVPNFELTETNRPLVADICRIADGVPLVLELAAALVRRQSLDEILLAMTERLDALEDSRRDRSQHQQTLQASLEWSRRFLSDGDARLLDRLSVFGGGFTAEAARLLAEDGDGNGGDNRGEGAGDVGRLVDHSLVSFDLETGRYRLLEVVRADAESRLAPDERAEAVRRHHAFCLLVVDRIAELWPKPDPDAVFHRFDWELPNLCLAVRRCFEADDLDGFRSLFGPIAVWWVHTLPPDNPEIWSGAFDDEAVPLSWRANVTSALSFYWSHRGDHEQAVALAATAVRQHAEAGAEMGQAMAMLAGGNAKAALGRDEAALADYSAALDLSVQGGHRFPELLARLVLARLATAPDARNHLSQALPVAKTGFNSVEALVNVELGLLAAAEGDRVGARAHCDVALELARTHGFTEALATALCARGEVAVGDHDMKTAADLFTEALHIGQASFHEGVMARARAGLDSIRPDQGSGSGSASSVGGAVGSGPDGAVVAAVEPAEALSEREVAVARLLRGDLTQREIADELYIAPSTVKTHTKSIYRKLGVSKRSHAITRAAELGLFG